MSMDNGLSTIGIVTNTFYFKLAQLSSNVDSSSMHFLKVCIEIGNLGKLIFHSFVLKPDGYVNTLNKLCILNPFLFFLFFSSLA
jgi:hypothetical protein